MNPESTPDQVLLPPLAKLGIARRRAAARDALAQVQFDSGLPLLDDAKHAFSSDLFRLGKIRAS